MRNWISRLVLGLALLVPALGQQNYNVNVGGINYSSGPTTPVGCPVNGAFFFNNTTSLWFECVNNNFQSLTNVAVIDGASTPQQLYSAPGFNGGTIVWNPAPGQNVSAPFDIFQNRTVPVQPTVTLTTSCAGVTHGFLTGNTNTWLAVYQVQYSQAGNTLYSPVTQVQETATASLCYTVSPSNKIFGALFSTPRSLYVTLALECTGGPCPLTNGYPANATIQFATTAGLTNYAFNDISVTRTYNLTTAATAAFSGFSPNSTAIPNNGGVEVSYTTILLGGGQGSQFTLMPSALGQYDRLAGIGRNITLVQLSSSAPNAVPYLGINGLLSSGSTQTEVVGQTRTQVFSLVERNTAGSIVESTLSPLWALPPFSAGFRNEAINVPAPPYFPQAEIPNTTYILGQRFTDNSTTPSVWRATNTNGFGTTTNNITQLGNGLPCTSEGTTQTEAGGLQAQCVMKGQRVAAQAYAFLDEVYDPVNAGYWEVSDAAGCTSAAPTFPSNSLIGVPFTDNTCHWYFLGLTTVAHPGWKIYIRSQVVSASFQLGASAPLLDTTKGDATNHVTAIWSSCTTASANCGTGSQQTISVLGDATTGSVPQPSSTPADAGACTALGLVCNTSTLTYSVTVVWVTPTGVSTQSGIATVAITAGHAIKIPWSSLGLAPPSNAIGWTVAVTSSATQGPEPPLQAVDGWNTGCAPAGTSTLNVLSAYAQGMQHGGACALGADVFVMTPIAGQPYTPFRGPSDNFFAFEVFANQTSQGIPFYNTTVGASGTTPACYGCRIDNLSIEMGRQLNVIEAGGVCILDQDGQEFSGIGADNSGVQLSDCALAGVYKYSFTSQNSGENGIHWTGLPWDYTLGGIYIENFAGPRKFSNSSLMGPAQAAQFYPMAGMWVWGAPFLKQNSVGLIEANECEAGYSAIRIDNAAATITSIVPGGVASRQCFDTVDLGAWAHDVFISGLNTNSSSTCAVMNESPSALSPGGNCDTTAQFLLPFYYETSAGGNGGNGVFICSSDPVEGCSTGPSGKRNPVRLTANSAGITATTPGTVVFTLPALAGLASQQPTSFHCSIMYQQATAAGGVGFAVQGANNAPGRIDAEATIFTSNAGASIQSQIANLTTTTATPFTTATPSAINTTFNAQIDGTIVPNATAINFVTPTIYAYTGNASDAVTILAGSQCWEQ